VRSRSISQHRYIKRERRAAPVRSAPFVHSTSGNDSGVFSASTNLPAGLLIQIPFPRTWEQLNVLRTNRISDGFHRWPLECSPKTCGIGRPVLLGNVPGRAAAHYRERRRTWERFNLVTKCIGTVARVHRYQE
jgi:hypothetical protein